jgi:hypothetical protein
LVHVRDDPTLRLRAQRVGTQDAIGAEPTRGGETAVPVEATGDAPIEAEVELLQIPPRLRIVATIARDIGLWAGGDDLAQRTQATPEK